MCIRDSLEKDVTALTFATANSYGDWKAHTVNTGLQCDVQQNVRQNCLHFGTFITQEILTYGTYKGSWTVSDVQIDIS